MKLLNRKRKKIKKLRAKIKAWNEVWGSVKEKIPSFEISRLERMKAELYELTDEDLIK